MSVVLPAQLAVEATRALARSALPDAPVEPDRVRTRSRVLGYLRSLRGTATGATPFGRDRRQADHEPRSDDCGVALGSA